MKKTIVFNATNTYLDKLTTTIKSILAYNDTIDFYILNEDIAQEWFIVMKKKLQILQSDIHNIRVDSSVVSQFSLPTQHLHYSAYFRYFIADILPEDRALYLDCDIIVTDTLDELFSFELDNFPLAAVPDLPFSTSTFNSGVLLLNLSYWRTHSVSKELIQLTIQQHRNVYGDQEILNQFFENRWKVLPFEYNVQVGADSHRFLQGDLVWYEETYSKIPKIIHYTTERKPWNRERFNRYREIWWKFYGLDWSEILLRQGKIFINFDHIFDTPKFHAIIFTESGDILHLEQLIKTFPNIQFHIGAPTLFWEGITKLDSHPNVAIYPAFDPYTKKKLIDLADIYLDINYGGGT